MRHRHQAAQQADWRLLCSPTQGRHGDSRAELLDGTRVTTLMDGIWICRANRIFEWILGSRSDLPTLRFMLSKSHGCKAQVLRSTTTRLTMNLRCHPFSKVWSTIRVYIKSYVFSFLLFYFAIDLWHLSMGDMRPLRKKGILVEWSVHSKKEYNDSTNESTDRNTYTGFRITYTYHDQVLIP